jgi:hypothetical protein
MPDLKSTLTYIQNMADNDDLDLLIAALVKRRRALSATQGAIVRDTIEVGSKVKLISTGLKPKYLQGLTGKVVTLDMTKALVDFGAPIGKYHSGRINVPFSLIAEVL